MSNTIELVLVGNAGAAVQSKIDSLNLGFLVYPNQGLDGGIQLVFSTQIRATSVNADTSRAQVTELIRIVESVGESDIDGSVLSLTVEDDNDILTGAYTSKPFEV
ncbi:hypothetical protein [Vibrio sp. D431a]|uniref:hypothetical protein n=1 Tax=Vibrio sp. D431a TaxID=2837388 RepID=UPI002552815C|nr:hypothetical protein [Vibrio sp. D431a]MDK9790009.1 hypothetical protein [Vibrio sp. D431a]